jgi:hypothetical protein
MKAAENGGCGQLTGCSCSSRSEPARASGGLGVQAAMGAAVVIADVFAKDALGVALAEDQDVIEAVATERSATPRGFWHRTASPPGSSPAPCRSQESISLRTQIG